MAIEIDSENVVASVDLDNYASMARRMCRGSRGLVLCDCDGQILKASNDALREHMASLGAQRPEWAQNIERWDRIDGEADDTALVMRLDIDSNYLFLVWWVAPEIGAGDDDPFDTVLSLSVCMRNELSMHKELDSLAEELTERYEELNLVYHTEDRVSFYREGYEAFRALVKNCADYLDAGLAILYLPGKNVYLTSGAAADEFDMCLVKAALDNGIVDQVRKLNQTVFVNNSSDKAALVPQGTPYRLMACPVSGVSTRVDGVLVIVNPLVRREFSNSDKNLLSVIAKKAGKIIQGSYDGLTGLLNRAGFEHLLDTEVEHIRRRSGAHSLLHLNIDQLHRINDTLGHEAGDYVICEFARLACAEFRDTDSIARIGGDEIGVLVQNCSEKKALEIADKLRKIINAHHLEWDGAEINATVSIGIEGITDSTENGESALKHAVVACDVAKENGGDSVRSYSHDDEKLVEREASMWMVATIQQALRQDNFLLYAQPIEPLRTGIEAHFEILLRMRDDGKIVAPHAFLPASERYQLMTDIDRWVVTASLEQLGHYFRGEPRVRPIVGINLSGQSLCKPEFLDFIVERLRASDVPSDAICFEITETAAVSNMQDAQRFIAALREEGCSFALDDFGAGLSSFGYLKSFDVQYLKIDGALVRGIEDDNVAAAMVESVNQIGHVMGLETIAEFVESAETKSMLEKMGVDYIQGYLLGKPCPLTELLETYDKNPSSVAV